MNLDYPVVLYFDASCPLCRKELTALKAHDRQDRLLLRDCSAVDFHDEAVERAGLTRADLMRAIHARDQTDRWFVGIDVFVLAYRAGGIEWLAKLWAHPRLRPLWDRLYPWVARHRMALSRLGVNAAFDFLLRRLATRAKRRAQGCDNQHCSVR